MGLRTVTAPQVDALQDVWPVSMETRVTANAAETVTIPFAVGQLVHVTDVEVVTMVIHAPEYAVLAARVINVTRSVATAHMGAKAAIMDHSV